MITTFETMKTYRQQEAALWKSEWILKQVEALNSRFEDRVLHAVTVRDELRRGIRQSDEEIEVTLYQWMHRFAAKTARYAFLDDVTIGHLKGRLIFDLLETVSYFEPFMTQEAFKQAFLLRHPELAPLDAWSYGGPSADRLALLTRSGVKTATASAYPLYAAEGETVPKEGDVSLILYDTGAACCAVRTTDVEMVPFRDVTRMHAYLEGEGDRTLAYWRVTHHLFFRRALEQHGLTFDEALPVLCERFEVLEDCWSVAQGGAR